jgi:histone acetyltransferase HTATIP
MAENNTSIGWPLRSIAVDNKVVRFSVYLLLDRANSEFGVIYYPQPGVAVLVTGSETDEPIYFAVSKIRGACARFSGTCKKVCVQMQGSQIDFEFTLSGDASDFVKQLGILATKVHNVYFEFFETSK